MTINKKPARTGTSGCNGRVRKVFPIINESDTKRYYDYWRKRGEAIPKEAEIWREIRREIEMKMIFGNPATPKRQ